MTAETNTRDYDRHGRWPIENLRLIEFTGEDRDTWLQGQITNDLISAAMGERVSFCCCSAKGQIEAVCDAWRLPDRTLVSCDEAFVDAILRRVEDMVIMEDVSATVSPLRCFTIQGQDAQPIEQALILPNDRFGDGGFDAWVAHQRAFDADVSEDDAERWRIEAGIPRVGFDFDGRTLPPELGPDFEQRHVSYRKGCYTGQEVLMRIHSRGHTNKTLVRIDTRPEFERGDAIMDGERTVGMLTSTTGRFGLAMIRNDAGPNLTIRGIRIR